jgi:transaldolase
MGNLLKLIDYGQSYWLDNITRDKILSGELKRRVDNEGLKGVTSNPSIFYKAISGSSSYNEQISQLLREKKPTDEIFEEIAVKDVQDACDILRTVYDSTNGLDGYVSIEVSPYFANNTERTMIEARRLFTKVNRPNCLVKIPGTKAGIPAIEQMLYEGININITLLFSITDYETVAHAYINALKRRTSEGKPVKDIASVASFFLSRIDVITDKLLEQLDYKNIRPNPKELLGKTAIASAKLAYQSFKKIFGGIEWKRLSEKGARVQRPLWASTGTKDPLSSDVKYVEPLIGKHTVNTMPDETIIAFKDHGIIVKDTVEKDIQSAECVLSDLKKIGIDIFTITDQLTKDGIKKFIESYDAIIECLLKKNIL